MGPKEITKNFKGDVVLNAEQDAPAVDLVSPKKTVHFADSKGLALAATYFFPKVQQNICCENVDCRGLDMRVKELNLSRNGDCGTKILNFRPPTSEKCLEETVEKHKVCLEEISCSHNEICGRIRVSNIAFEKTISVRYTTDSWLTYKEELASYVPGASTGSTDTFAFRIRFAQGGNEDSVNKRMEFVIRYNVGESEFWDNNYGDNYRLVYF